ncbi:unnamed protein product [Nippostrongylus brasiliensis]|uniref:PAN domain protein n=1 Tax=Nippostrongylus brasiliensis TaxID=27835 RepID=A0A0N4YUM8_NIPBR|nr:unnamed protein product [Nippostrongylus brasiliensis]
MLPLLLVLPSISLAMSIRCFDRIRNHTLIGAVVVTLDDVTLTQCQRACLEVKKQNCRSFMYHTARSRCFVNSEDMKTADNSFFPVLDSIDYYHRTCYRTSSMGGKPLMSFQRDSVFDEKCYETVKGKVLIGIVDQLIQGVTSIEECRKRCQKSKEASDIVCKSAIYYEKEKECIIASQSRSDIPDLFIEDDQAVYMENTCLNDSKSNMKKLKGMESKTDETTMTSPSTMKKAPNHVELSGYDSPSDTVGEHSGSIDVMTTTSSTTTTTEKPTTTINPKVIDTYNADAAVKTPVEVGYGKRLRDSKIKECFTCVIKGEEFSLSHYREVRPLRPMDQTRITKAYSLEQCTDICRLCWRCLHGKKCLGVAFDL